MIDGKNFFDHPVKNDLKTYENIWKIATSQGEDYTTGSLLDYTCFKNYYNMISMDLRKQQVLDADSKANTANQFYCKSRLSRPNNNIFHYWRSKRNRFRFFTRNCESAVILFCFKILLVWNDSI